MGKSALPNMDSLSLVAMALLALTITHIVCYLELQVLKPKATLFSQHSCCPHFQSLFFSSLHMSR